MIDLRPRSTPGAVSLLNKLWTSVCGCLSVQVLQEFYVTVTQKVLQPVEHETAAQIVRDLSFWRLHATVVEDVLGAIDLQQRCALSFRDAMILWSAQHLDCRTLWSEDFNPNQNYNGVIVINPFVE